MVNIKTNTNVGYSNFETALKILRKALSNSVIAAANKSNVKTVSESREQKTGRGQRSFASCTSW